MKFFNKNKTETLDENTNISAGSEKKTKTRKDGKSLTTLVLSFAISIIVFIGVVSFESYILEDKNTTNVVQAVKDIPEKTIITAENANQYLTMTAVNSALVFDGCYSSVEDVAGQVLVDISKGEIISASNVADIYNENASIKDAVEISIKASDLSQAVSGTLRAGDKINVSIVAEKDNKIISTKILPNVFVSSVYDSSCTLIDPTDKYANAAYVNIMIPSSDEKEVNEALYSGTLRISKITN